MKTLVKLTIDGTTHELSPDCLKNWEDVACTYKRGDYNGVVRSFTSKFEFFAEGYDLLLAEYLANRYEGCAVVSVWTMEGDWTYRERFSCPLDFSTVEIADNVFSISAVDNSVAAMIKANKGTKYEMAVGSDIRSDGMFHFDRVPMLESVLYGFTQGVSEEDTGALKIAISKTDHDVIWLGSISSEITVGGSIYWKDDQEDEADGYMIRAVKPVTVSLKSTVVTDSAYGSDKISRVIVQRLNADGNVVQTAVLCELGRRYYGDVGAFPSAADLRDAYPEHSGNLADGEARIAEVDGIVWRFMYTGGLSQWVNTGKSRSECDFLKIAYTLDAAFDMAEDDKIRAVISWDSGTRYVTSRVLSSSIQFSWEGRGEMCDIPAFKPATVMDAILRKACAGSANVSCRISGHDKRLSSTVLMAAEDVRAISGAKLYSSFTEFCDWMETVFGYTYYLGESWDSPLTGETKEFGGFVGTPYPQSDGTPPVVFEATDIVYNNANGKFMLSKGGHWYTWRGSGDYNDIVEGTPWNDRLFRFGNAHYYFRGTEPAEYLGDPADKERKFQEIVFCHRSELFNPAAFVFVIGQAKEVSYSVDSNYIYSAVEIGYEKKDYDNINGRCEFNFANTYSTGCVVSDKKLSLISKYRADCYGIEFAAQKRGEDTTDTTSDNDVFFVHATVDGRDFKPRRDAAIEGALTDGVFNAAFCPMACVSANEGYIGMQAERLKLSFASSTGNSDVSIDGLPMTSDIELSNPLLSPSVLEFETNAASLPGTDDLVQVEDRGLRYTGFVSEVEERYSREAPVKYKLLVKSIEPC